MLWVREENGGNLRFTAVSEKSGSGDEGLLVRKTVDQSVKGGGTELGLKEDW